LGGEFDKQPDLLRRARNMHKAEVWSSPDVSLSSLTRRTTWIPNRRELVSLSQLRQRGWPCLEKVRLLETPADCSPRVQDNCGYTPGIGKIRGRANWSPNASGCTNSRPASGGLSILLEPSLPPSRRFIDENRNTPH